MCLSRIGPHAAMWWHMWGWGESPVTSDPSQENGINKNRVVFVLFFLARLCSSILV